MTTAPVPPTRLRLTVRGRRVVALAVAAPIALAVSFAVSTGGAALAAAGSSDGTASGFEYVTVVSGDTLWSIAEDTAPGVDPRDAVAAIARLNAIDAAGLRVGEVVAIPREFTG